MAVAHFGTFDVQNYGDLLFPLILEQRLAAIGQEFVHVSPRGGPPVWGDCVSTVAVETILDDPADVTAVVVGGGHIIHASPTTLDAYDKGEISAVVAYPSLWLGAANLSAERNIPLCWNAPGVPQTLSAPIARLAQWATSVADYLAVRDKESRARLTEAGVTRAIRVVPDTGLEVSRLWSPDEVDAAYAAAFADRGREVPERTVAIHLNRRYLGEGIDSLAARLDQICRRLGATAILIAIGPCHGDAELQRRVGQYMTTTPLVIDQPQSLREVAACIARSQAYLGSSLHGMITACSYGRRGLVVVPATAGTFGKFVGFLEPFQLTRWLCATWEDAERCVDELVAAPISAWARVLDAATPTLDRHWKRVQAVVGSSSDGQRRRIAPVDKHSALDRLRELDGDLGRASSLYAVVIAEQARRVRDIQATVERLQRQRDELEARLAGAEHDRRQAGKVAQRQLTEAARRIEEVETARAAQLAAYQQRLAEVEEARGAERVKAQEGLAARLEVAEEERRRREELEREREQLRSEVAAAQGAAEAGRQRLEDLEQELASALGAVKKERQRREELERNLAAALGATEEERRLRDELGRECERLLSELAMRLSADEEERRENDEAGQEIVEVGRRLAEVDARLARLTERSRRGSDQELEAAQLELMKARRDLGRVRKQLAHRAEVPKPASQVPAAPNGRPLAELIDGRGPSIPHPALAAPHATPQNGVVTAPEQMAGAVVAEVVICVHNALDDVKRCLASVLRHTDARHHAILVDDGSDDETASYLMSFTEAHPRFTLIRNDQARGYTKAANQGLRASTGELVVLLNSDTIVTPLWLERLLDCAQGDPKIGIVGPLSNAASYQSVPECVDPSGGWALNPLPAGWDPTQVAEVVASLSNRAFPRVPFLNGFCFAIKRPVIEAIGYLDEEGFSEGYGEENDYSLRAAAAGFDLAIADHAYVFHAKSKSFSHERRRGLAKTGTDVLRQKHGRERITAGEGVLRAEPTLAAIRRELGTYLRETSPRPSSPSVLFLLPVSGGGGGAHSIVQETHGMRQLGMNAQVAVRAKHLPEYFEQYASMRGADDLFFGFRTSDDLIDHAANFDAVVATIYTSIPLLASIVARSPGVVPAYYVQDYEPWFYPEGSPKRTEAAASYTLVPGTVNFAKTQWLCDTVRNVHGVEVQKVRPSLDRDVYFPPPALRSQAWPVRVAAMVRPTTPRRGAARTMNVLRELKEEFGKRVDVHIFGCREADLAGYGLRDNFEFTNRGLLVREQVARLLRDADVFLDLSDYQAFGRTGLEAMACGCAVVVPAAGGTGEYAIHRENALIADTSIEGQCHAAARELVADPALRQRLQQAAMAKADEYSVHRAVLSEIALFANLPAARDEIVAGRV